MSEGMTPMTGRLPRLLTPSILWTGGCIEYPYKGDRIHSHMSTYVVRGSRKSVIVDTGNPYHVNNIFPDVQNFLAGRPLDYVFPTHYEFPHAGLLPNWMEHYPDAILVGDLPETDLYYPEFADRLQPVKVGDSIDLGDRELVFVPAVWRDINTLWAFDTKDRVLFVSDAFAYLHYHHDGQCDQVDSEQGPIDPTMVKFSNDLTMNWTRYTDAVSNLTEIEKLIGMLKPKLICPAHGTVVDKAEAMIPRMNHGLPVGA